jgi:uncharacterized membrane protein YcfT
MVGSPKALVWVDLAKSACIILVILYHAEKITEASGWVHQAEISRAWCAISTFLQPIRMPTFFLLSGVLASRSIMSPSADTIHKRLTKPMYLYVLWGAVFVLIVPAYPHTYQLGVGLVTRVQVVCFGLSPAWYLMALSAYYCAAAVTREWRINVLLVICAGLSILGSLLSPSTSNHVPNIARCLFFFIVGVRMKDAVLVFAAAASAQILVLTAFLWIVGSTICVMLGNFLLPVDMVAAAFAIQAVALIGARWHNLHRPARWLAQRTLQTYVLHFLMLAYFGHLMKAHLSPTALESLCLGLLAPLVATAFALPASLMAGELMKRHRLWWMFDLPETWQLSPRHSASG